MPIITLSVKKWEDNSYAEFLSSLPILRDTIITTVAQAFLDADDGLDANLLNYISATEFKFEEYGPYDKRCKPITVTVEADWSSLRNSKIEKIAERILRSFYNSSPNLGNLIQVWVRLTVGSYCTTEMLTENE